MLPLNCLRAAAVFVAMAGTFWLERDASAQTRPTTNVSLSPEAVPYAERSQIRDFTIHVHFQRRPTTVPTVMLTLDTGRGDPRHFAALPDADAPNGVFRVSATLIPEYLHPKRLRIVANYPNGTVNCTVQDTEIEIGKRTVMLSEIRHADGGKLLHLTLDTGETLSAPPTGVQNLRGDLGPVTITLNLARADSFSVQPLHPSLASVAYKVEVKEADTLVAETSGEIPVNGTPPATSPAAER